MNGILSALPLAFVFLFLACSSEPEFQRIDQLLHEGQFEQAKNLIERELSKEWADTLQQKRLEYRLIKAERGIIFKQIDSLADQNPLQGLERLRQLEDSLQRRNQAKMRYYAFDIYLRRARLFKTLKQDSLWFKEVGKALTAFTDQYEVKRDLYEQCAFYLAGQGKYDQGLKMLDHSFRGISLHHLTPELKDVYFAYFNGEFAKALTLLERLKEDQKDRHWMNLQNYLKKYGQHLSMEERFKLW